MIPFHSCEVPGRKPGTSQNVTIGMLNASQVRMNRAAFSDASMSSTPAIWFGWLPTMPTAWPSIRPKPQRMFRAKCSWTSKNSPSSTVSLTTFRMSYGLFGLAGTASSSSGTSWSTGSLVGTTGGVSRLFCGRKPSRNRVSSIAWSSSSKAKCATPDLVLCDIAPPSSSNPTSSPVTVLITSGPVMNMWEVSLTIPMKSVIAGE